MTRSQNSVEGRRRIVAMVCLFVGLAVPSAQASKREVLRITVGEPTVLSALCYQNCSSLAVSRTGVVAAFFSKPPGTGPKWYRTSTDQGKTWGAEMDSPPQLCGGAESVALRDGGVLKYLTDGTSFQGEAEFGVSPMEGQFKDGWFTLHSTFAWFNDDFTKYETGTTRVYMPDAVTSKQTQLATSFWPIFDKGKILQLADGDLLAPMYGVFKGDVNSRVVLSRSSDQGHTWRYWATVAAGGSRDPNPELPGWYVGFCEPTIALLPDGRLICVMRTQYAHLPAEYRPLYVAWSSDLGKTWTTPTPTSPHLMNIWPTLAVLDNGVVVCQYGRPGFHVVFSTDSGRTWRDRVSLSDLHEPIITGQFDMIKVGPNRVVVIGNDAGGTKVWPIDVERRKVSPARTEITGRVLDAQGAPLAGARVELGPNRYTADAWVEGDELDVWKAGPTLVRPPVLKYQALGGRSRSPIATTDAEGTFRFRREKLAEYVLTVEAAGYAPQWRQINVASDARQRSQDFRLSPGRSLRGNVVDDAGKPVGGACVVLGKLHLHADHDGRFSWAVEAPVPADVAVRVYKRYNNGYNAFEGKLSLAQLEASPIVLQRAK